MNTKVSPAIRVRWISGLVPAQALTAAGRVEPNGEPGAGGAVVEDNGISQGAGEGALARSVGHASESSAAVGGDRRT